LLTRSIAVSDALRFKSFLKHFSGKMALFGNGFASFSGVAERIGNRQYETAGEIQSALPGSRPVYTKGR